VPESEARVMALLRHASHLNFEKLKVIRFVLGLNSSMRARVYYLMPQTLHDVVPKAVVQDEFSFTGWLQKPNRRLEEGLRAVPLTWESLSRESTCTSRS
jgi:hypothetical protein